MNTAEIVEKCRDLPGVTARRERNAVELRLSGPEGEGRMRFFPAFPGIALALISVKAPVWPVFQTEGCPAESPLLINYCLRGRCELVLNDNCHVFLTSGQVSLTERFAQQEYIYPGKEYEGIEVFIDPETVRDELALLRDGFGIELKRLRELYCPEGETFIAGMQLPPALLERLTSFAELPSEQSAVACKTALIDFLALLLYEKPAPETVHPAYYTRSQVAIAKQTRSIITSDLAAQHTVREFAERFSISESSVKNYFYGVYGQSISQYTAHQRMLEAARLLTGTRLSVIEVAGRVGYVNQSKFAAAFRREFACTPLEYRRKKSVSSAG